MVMSVPCGIACRGASVSWTWFSAHWTDEVSVTASVRNSLEQKSRCKVSTGHVVALARQDRVADLAML
eukprot:457571-Rhodomonas_salina.2